MHLDGRLVRVGRWGELEGVVDGKGVVEAKAVADCVAVPPPLFLLLVVGVGLWGENELLGGEGLVVLVVLAIESAVKDCEREGGEVGEEEEVAVSPLAPKLGVPAPILPLALPLEEPCKDALPLVEALPLDVPTPPPPAPELGEEVGVLDPLPLRVPPSSTPSAPTLLPKEGDKSEEGEGIVEIVRDKVGVVEGHADDEKGGERVGRVGVVVPPLRTPLGVGVDRIGGEAVGFMGEGVVERQREDVEVVEGWEDIEARLEGVGVKVTDVELVGNPEAVPGAKDGELEEDPQFD